jgi:hypothetical protein
MKLITTDLVVAVVGGMYDGSAGEGEHTRVQFLKQPVT